MSRNEVDRVGVMQQVAARRILQQEAAARLGISVRQVKRLLARLRGEGPQGLVSRRPRRPCRGGWSRSMALPMIGWRIGDPAAP
nr:helix-turn-helix domain-containing protein [Acidithiobacillus ferrianus]